MGVKTIYTCYLLLISGYVNYVIRVCFFCSSDQLRDHLGHPYTVRDVRVRLSEPNSEPMAEVKLHQLLSSVVRWSDTGTGPRAEYGNVTTNGEIYFLMMR